MREKILELIGNKKMMLDEILVYFDEPEHKIKEELDKLIKENKLKCENNKYFINFYNYAVDDLFEFIKENDYASYLFLDKKFHLKKEVLNEYLNILIKDEKIIKIKSKKDERFCFINRGKIYLKDREYYIRSSITSSDYYVGQEKNIKFVHQDDYCTFYFDSFNANIIDVLKRGHDTLIGIIDTDPEYTNTIYFYPFTRGFRPRRLSKELLDGVNLGDIVILKIKYTGKTIRNEKILKILGNKKDKLIEVKTKIYEFEYEEEFNDEVKKEALNIPQEVLKEELKNRKDYRDLNIITIDNDDSKDFDDAVYVEKLENGNYRLGVYIADVAHYVKEGSKLDIEARKRGTSVYFANTVIPMLPFELSNGICSLNENVDRLVLDCIMEIDLKGEVINYKIEEAVIKSHHQLTYSRVNKVFEGNDDLCDTKDMLFLMLELSNILRKRREKKGALDFDTEEYHFDIDEDKNINGVSLKARGKAEKMIEDFMLIANETIAYNAKIMELPILYRVHENPDKEKLDTVLKTIKELGYKYKNTQNEIHSKNLQQLLLNLKDNENYDIISNMLLRSMAKAKYSEENLGHYGLQLEDYCHFTSPIRRYPDLITHRVIKKLMINVKDYENTLNHFIDIMPYVAEETSTTERKAVDFERKIDEILYAIYYNNKRKLKEKYTGKITSFTKFGMFIKLKDGAEGLLAYRNMPYFVEVNDTMTEARDFERKYKIGEKLEVSVAWIDTYSGKIDFIYKEDEFIDDEW